MVMTQSSLPLLLLLVPLLAAGVCAGDGDGDDSSDGLAAGARREIPFDAGYEEGDELNRKVGKLRRVQAASFFPADDPYWNPAGIMERKPCIPFEGIREDQITDGNADESCSTNSCGGGCCRAYNWLLCDTDSSFAYLACVCNDETWPADQWTRAPSVQAPTSPTPLPTLFPTPMESMAPVDTNSTTPPVDTMPPVDSTLPPATNSTDTLPPVNTLPPVDTLPPIDSNVTAVPVPIPPIGTAPPGDTSTLPPIDTNTTAVPVPIPAESTLVARTTTTP